MKFVSKGQLKIKYGKSQIQNDEETVEDVYMLIQNPSGDPVDIPDLQFVGFQNGFRVYRPKSDIVFVFGT